MSKSRRQFLTHASLALLGAASGCRSKPQKSAELPPGAPPTFGAATVIGPEVSAATFAQAEKLMQVELTKAERDMAIEVGVRIWQRSTSGAQVRARWR